MNSSKANYTKPLIKIFVVDNTDPIADSERNLSTHNVGADEYGSDSYHSNLWGD